MKKIIVSVLAISMAFGIGLAEAKPDKEKPLPPGLQKKLYRGGELPPGWQNKLIVGEYLDYEVYRKAGLVVPSGKTGVVNVQIEDRSVQVIEATREIIEILE